MKKSFRMIAIIAAVALVIGAIPVTFALSNVNYKKSWADPLPLTLIPDSSYPIIIGNSIDYSNRIYLSDTLQSQRVMLEYGKTHGEISVQDGYWEEGDHPLDFAVSPATMEAYGLTKDTLKKYLRQYHYSRQDMTRLSYDGGEWTSHREFNQDDILPLKDISIAFADSFDLYPKDSWYMHIEGNRLEAYVVGNPTFNFFMTNGPELYNTDYAPADGILYDAAITKGAAEEDLEVYFRVREEVIFDEDTDEPIGYEDEHNLQTEAPREVTVTGIDNDYSDTEAIIPITIPDTNDQINYFISADYLNTLDTGIYYFEFAFEKGTSVFILQVNEPPCDKSEENCASYHFADLDANAWYHAAVDFVAENSLMNGTDPTTFSPNLLCDRAQFVTLLWRIADCPEATGTHPFTDVPEDAYYADAVAWAHEEEVVTGSTPTTFSPNLRLTREQVAVLMARFVQSRVGEPITMDYDLLNMFPDNASVSSWAKDGMLWACNEEVVKGKPNAYLEIILDPQGQITRAEIAQAIYNYFG